MKLRLLTIALLSSSLAVAQNNYQQLGEQFVRSEMTRHPEAWTIEQPQKGPKWNYTQGLEVLSMQGWLTEYQWVTYAKSYTDSLINDKGIIKGFKMKDFKLDAVNSGKILFMLYDQTKEERYKIAMDTLYSQILKQPKTPEGGMWHKTIYPDQMWLDGQYMGLPFYLEYVKRFCTKQEFDAAYDFVCQQIVMVTDHTLCPDCKLYHHAWDSAHKQPWANKKTGRSQHAWGRAEGWLMMTLVDCLAIRYNNRVPDAQGGTVDPLVKVLNYITDKLIPLQDPTTHTWQQVLDCTGKKGNYQEMTCTAMFAYAMLKGSRINAYQVGEKSGKDYWQTGKQAIDGIFAHYVSKDEQGLLSLNNCCAVAGLSDTRNGSFEYYLSEPVIDNDPKGIGPLFMAIKELADADRWSNRRGGNRRRNFSAR